MDAAELQAKATIAAALIASHIVSIQTLSSKSVSAPDHAAIELRALTDYVYAAIIDPVES